MQPRSPGAPGTPDGDRASSAIRASSKYDRYRAWLTWPSWSGSDQRTCASYADSVTGELAVGHPVRPRGVGTQPVDLVLLVRLEVALEPEPLRRVVLVALPGQ